MIKQTTTLQKILEEQFKHYKGIHLQDIYKLLHQGTFGSEHAIAEEHLESVRKYLYDEFEKAEPNKEEKLLERISPTFRIYRINIRPYKYYNGDEDALFEWFYQSSKIKEGAAKDFLTFWEVFKMINKEKKYFQKKEVKKFEKEYITGKGLEAMHHSKQYEEANKPSYRVVNLKTVNCPIPMKE